MRVAVKRLTSVLIHPTAAEWDHLPPQSLTQSSGHTIDFNRLVVSKRGGVHTNIYTLMSMSDFFLSGQRQDAITIIAMRT